jgi:hypothetical protein
VAGQSDQSVTFAVTTLAPEISSISLTSGPAFDEHGMVLLNQWPRIQLVA